MGRGREVAALLLWTCAVFLALALASYAGDPVHGDEVGAGVTPPGANWVGPVGELIARGLVTLIGIVSWTVPFELVLLGVPLIRGRPSPATGARLAGDLLIVILAAALVQVGWPGKTAFGTHPSGGMVGELFGELGRSLFSTLGSFIVGFASLALILIARASFSFIAFARALATAVSTAAERVVMLLRKVVDAWRKAKELERQKKELERIASLPKIDIVPHDDALVAALPDDDAELGGAIGGLLADEENASPRKRRPRKKKDAPPIDVVAEIIPDVPLLPPPRLPKRLLP